MKHAKRVLRPFKYTPAVATSVARTIAKERQRLKAQSAVVTPLKRAK